MKLDIADISKLSNMDRMTEFETLDKLLSFKTYKELEDFNKKLQDEQYFNRMVRLSFL